MTKREYLDAAQEILIERQAEAGKEFNGSLDAIVGLACTMSLKDLNVRHLGQTVRILKGRHRGFRGEIEMIDWNEAAIRLRKNPRWFCCWGDTNLFEVL